MNATMDDFFKFLGELRRTQTIKPLTLRNWISASRRVLPFLTESEKSDLQKIDINDLMKRFADARPGVYSDKSLADYKSRISKVLAEFHQYLQDPRQYFAVLKARHESLIQIIQAPFSNTQQQHNESQNKATGISKPIFGEGKISAGFSIPIPIRNNHVVELTNVPIDLTEGEADKIASVIKALASKGA